MTTPSGIEELDEVLNRPSSARSRDEHHRISRELAAMAPRYIRTIDELFDAGAYERTTLIWCLIGEDCREAVELFAKGLADKSRYTRWAAAEALSKCTGPVASALLVAALEDRSHLVKGTAVDAMSEFRDPAAVPQLRRIVASRSLQRRAPGIVAAAKKALVACRPAD